MGYAQVRAIGLVGVDGHLVTVEAHVAGGLPGLVLSGLPDASLNEARDRVRAAVVNSGEAWPQRRSPSTCSRPTYPSAAPRSTSPSPSSSWPPPVSCLGRLAEARPRRRTRPGRSDPAGARRAADGAGGGPRRHPRGVIVPAPNAAEAALVPDVTVLAPGDAAAGHRVPAGGVAIPPPADAHRTRRGGRGPTWPTWSGRSAGGFALEVAAAGRHHLALIGPPGAGKTMLAQRLPSILPPLDDAAALEVTALHSIAGALPAGRGSSGGRRSRRRTTPRRSAALVGGGSGLARPGALSLAHHGVLFLDEAPHFGAACSTRCASRWRTARSRWPGRRAAPRYPARIQLVLAANPCPCGSAKDVACACAPAARRTYFSRLSGPLMDRIDLQVLLQPVSAASLLEKPAEESSAWCSSGWSRRGPSPRSAGPAAGSRSTPRHRARCCAARRSGCRLGHPGTGPTIGERHSLGARLRPGAAGRLVHRGPRWSNGAERHRCRRGTPVAHGGDRMRRDERTPVLTTAGQESTGFDARAAYIALGHLAEPGSRALGEFVLAVGPIQALRRLVDGVAPPTLQKTVGPRLARADPTDWRTWRCAARSGSAPG